MRLRNLLLAVLAFALMMGAARRPRTEVAVRVNTPELTIDHRAALAEEIARAINQPNVRVTVTMIDRVVPPSRGRAVAPRKSPSAVSVASR